MILKVSNGYLEFDESIEVEKKVKLFERMSSTEGDFSYSFSVPRTKNNDTLLQIYNTNNADRRWVRKIPAFILNDSGVTIHAGFLRVEAVNKREYVVSFFGGNSNWISELEVSLLEYSWSFYDNQTVTPLTDNGLLSDRRHPFFVTEEFPTFIKVTDVFNNILAMNGIKIAGELLADPIFNKLIVSAGYNKLAQQEIDNRKAQIGITATQIITYTSATVQFNNVTSPYYNSPNGNWNTSIYRYSLDTNVKSLVFNINLIFDSSGQFFLMILKNGTNAVYQKIYSSVDRITETIDGIAGSTGDYYEVQAAVLSSYFPYRALIEGTSVTVYPERFNTINASSVIPDMTGANFLSNIFRMLNMVASYNANTKVINTKKLDNIIRSEPVDLSEYLTIVEDNFEEFISDYGKNNLLVWDEQSEDFVEQYNKNNVYPYGSGVITIDNEFLEAETDIVEMDFVAPGQANYGFIGMALPLTNFLTVTVDDTLNLTSVSADISLGYEVPKFNFSGGAISYSGLYRIKESTVPEYNGTYFGITATTFFTAIAPYFGNATGKIELLKVSYNLNSDPILLLLNENQVIYNVSSVPEYYRNNLVPLTTLDTANFLSTANYQASLGFSDLKPFYFSNTERVLNKVVKSRAEGNIPEHIYNNIDFLGTIRINDGVYYPQVISGYKGSKFPVIFELIKVN